MYFNTAPKEMDQNLFFFLKEKIKGSIYDIKYFAGIGIFIHDPVEESKLDPNYSVKDTYIDIVDTSLPEKEFTKDGLITNTLIDFRAEDFNISRFEEKIEESKEVDMECYQSFVNFFEPLINEYKNGK